MFWRANNTKKEFIILFRISQFIKNLKNNINNKILYDELIQLCIDALKQYNSNIEGPDSFFDIFIKK